MLSIGCLQDLEFHDANHSLDRWESRRLSVYAWCLNLRKRTEQNDSKFDMELEQANPYDIT